MGKRISRFRQPGSPADQLDRSPINRSLLSDEEKTRIDQARRNETLAWMAHSVWISTWSLAGTSLLVLLGVGWCVAALLEHLPPVVAQANTHDVATAVGSAFGLALVAGLFSYSLTRAFHPVPIRTGRRIHGPVYAVAAAVAVALGAFLIARPWSFPTPNVLHYSSQQVAALVSSRQVVRGTLYQEPQASDFYFEVTIGAWIVTPTTPSDRSLYREVMNATGPGPAPRLAVVAAAVGKGQIAALRDRVSHLFDFGVAVGAGAVALFVVQRRRWNKPILVPPLEDQAVREILAASKKEKDRPPARDTNLVEEEGPDGSDGDKDASDNELSGPAH